MTITLAVAEDSVTIVSDVIGDFTGAEGESLTVSVTSNCGTAVDLDIAFEDVTGSTLVLPVADYDATLEAYPEGVMSFKVTLLTDVEKTEETGFLYVHRTVECLLLNFYASRKIDCLEELPCEKNFYFWPYVFHDLLKSIGVCDEFTYANACTLWETMNTLLSEEYNCGCQ